MDHDYVLGPSQDGGYYLIGLNAACLNIFDNIDWGTSSVLHQTLDQIRSINQTVYQLNQKEDIDTAESFQRFFEGSQLSFAPHTNRFLGQSSLAQAHA